MTVVDVAGVRTRVHARGSGDAVLLIHGSGPGASAEANWRLLMPVLDERFMVVAPDLIGFGDTDCPDDFPFTLRAWTDHVIAVIDGLGVERAHVIGNSFGGAVALDIAIRYPERLGRLVLMGSVGTHFPITEALDATWGYEPSVEAMADLLARFAYDQAPIGPDLAKMRYETSLLRQDTFRRMFPAPRQRWVDAFAHPAEALEAITATTLIIHGREDRVIPLASSLELLHRIPDAQLHVFGRCGHWTQIEHADAFNALVADFLLSA